MFKHTYNRGRETKKGAIGAFNDYVIKKLLFICKK
jgi:hypothetical protein